MLRLALGEDVRVRELPFDRILDEVASGRADAGLRDPRGPAHLRRRGPHKALDLGEWWQDETGLPLPLGVNVARRDLGDRLADVSAVLGEAIRVGLEHRDEALAYARAVRPRDRRARRPTASSRCTSTSSRSTTATMAGARSRSCCAARARASRPSSSATAHSAARAGSRMRGIGEGNRKSTPASAPTVAIQSVGRTPIAAPSGPPSSDPERPHPVVHCRVGALEARAEAVGHERLEDRAGLDVEDHDADARAELGQEEAREHDPLAARPRAGSSRSGAGKTMQPSDERGPSDPRLRRPAIPAPISPPAAPAPSTRPSVAGSDVRASASRRG